MVFLLSQIMVLNQPQARASTVQRDPTVQNLIHEFAIPTNNSGPLAMAAGGNDTLWFSEFLAGKVAGFSTLDHSFREFTIPENGSRPAALAVDRFNHVWFADQSGSGSVWMLDPSTSKFTQYRTQTQNSTPLFVLIDQKNNIWFTELTGNNIGELTYPTYAMTEYRLPTAGSGPAELWMQAGSTTIWLTETYANRIASFDVSSHSYREYSPSVSLNSPVGIAADGAGKIWVAEHGGSSIVEFDSSQTSWRKFPTSVPPSSAGYLISAPATLAIDGHGKLWFVEHFSNKIGRLDPVTGLIDEFVIPTAGAYSVLNTLDSSGNFWFTQYSANLIGSISNDAKPSLSVTPESNQTISVAAGLTTSTLVRVTNKLSIPVRVVLNSSSSFSASGQTTPKEVSMNSSSFALAPHEAMVFSVAITPDASLPTGLYSVGVDASSSNTSAISTLFITVRNDFYFLSLIESNLPIVAIAIGVFMVGVYLVLKRSTIRKIDNAGKLGASAPAIVGLALTMFLLASNLTHANGKCPGLPSGSGNSDTYSTIELIVYITGIAVIGIWLARGLLRNRKRDKAAQDKDMAA